MAMERPDDMMTAVTASMRDRTGRTLEQWVHLVGAEGPDPLDQLAVRRWLKEQHGVLQNSAWTIADSAAQKAGWERPSVDGYIDGQYVGTRAALRPIFDRLRELAENLGDDVTVEGRSTYTPFVRGRQFAAVAAATRSRVDLGLRFVDVPASDRLAAAKAPGQSTHKIGLTSAGEVDAEVESLLRAAYDQNG